MIDDTVLAERKMITRLIVEALRGKASMSAIDLRRAVELRHPDENAVTRSMQIALGKGVIRLDPHLRVMLDEDFDAGPAIATSWRSRIDLAARGWRSMIRLSKHRTGGTDVGFWLKHDEWHGTLCDVSMHRVKILDCPPRQARPHLIEMLTAMAEQARAAWVAFPHSVPCQLPDGSFVVNTMETERFETYPQDRVFCPERANPTEALPGWPGQPGLDEFLDEAVQAGDGWLDRVLALVEDEPAIEWNDHLNPWARPGFYHLERRWQYVATPYVWEWAGQKLSAAGSRTTLKTEDLTPVGAAGLVEAFATAIETKRRLYPDRVPPGWTALAAIDPEPTPR